MNRIKFSKEYVKLHKQKRATLLLVRPIEITKETPYTELLDYDTLAEDGTRYEIGRGRFLQLVFLGDLGIPFCTIRSNLPAYNGMESKYEFYSKRTGQEFEIVRTWEIQG